jgi:hypothetical protein
MAAAGGATGAAAAQGTQPASHCLSGSTCLPCTWRKAGPRQVHLLHLAQGRFIHPLRLAWRKACTQCKACTWRKAGARQVHPLHQVQGRFIHPLRLAWRKACTRPCCTALAPALAQPPPIAQQPSSRRLPCAGCADTQTLGPPEGWCNTGTARGLVHRLPCACTDCLAQAARTPKHWDRPRAGA